MIDAKYPMCILLTCRRRLRFYAIAALLLIGAQSQPVRALDVPDRVTVNVDNLERDTDLQGELLRERRASLRRLGDPKFFGPMISQVRAYDVLAATNLMGCGKGDWPAFMVELPNVDTGQNPTEMFSLVALVRYLYQFGNCLTDTQKKQLLSNLNKPQVLLGHGTTNMAITQASSWYLLAQYFRDQTWFDLETKRTYTSAQLMAALKPLMTSRTHRIFQSGHYEWLSPNYAQLNIYPLLNLIDFAADDDVKRNANDEATLEVAMLKLHSFHGVIVPPVTRKNVDQRNSTDDPKSYSPSIAQQLLWYYFGEPHGLSLYDFRSGLGAFSISMLGISNWLPPSAVLNLDEPAVATDDHSVKTVTPRFTHWGDSVEPEIFGDSLITNDFSVGTANLVFEPNGYSGHIQAFSILLKSSKPHNEIECYQPYWHSNAGEDAWLVDRSSPFQQMYRYDESSVVMLFDIPKIDPWKSDASNRFWLERNEHANSLLQLANCRFARDFDEIVEEPNWIFIREGNVFVAMATLKGANEYDNASGGLLQHFTVLKVREPKTALFFRVERKRANLGFEQFRQEVKKGVPIYDLGSSSISLTEKDGTKTRVFFTLTKPLRGTYWSALPRIVKDGKSIEYDASYQVKSAGMSLRNGVLNIRTRGGAFVLSH